MKTKLSIIIVEYKSPKLVQRLTESIPEKEEWEVIVVDNSETNIGFGAGCNLGAKEATGEYLLFLNPDCIIQEGAIETLLERLEKDDEVGVAAPMLLDIKGEPYLSYSRQPRAGNAWIVYSFINKLLPNLPVVRKHWMKDEPLSKEKEVGIVSGAACMMRTEDFAALGGFDERYFLYWEETDLCRRVIEELHKKVLYVPEAKVVHEREGSTPTEKNEVREWFEESRSHYMQKFFGFKGSLIDSFLWVSEHWQIVLVLLLAVLLRVWQLPQLMPFFGDMGRDFLAASEALETGKLPLLGIPSSVPRFKQGPVYIWLITAVFSLFGRNPIAAAYMAASLGVLAVIGTYFLALGRWGKRPAWIASLVLAAAPLAVTQSRMAFHTNAIPLASVVYLWALIREPKSLWSYFLVGLAFAFLFQFELAVFPLLFLTLLYVWTHYKKPFTPWHKAGAVIGGGLVGLLPQVFFDLTHGFSQLGLFVVWVGYRLVSFAGLTGEHTASADRFVEAAGRFGEYGQKFFSWGSVPLTVGLALILLVGLFTYLKKRQFEWNLSSITWLWVLVVGEGFFVHSGPSEAYFPVLFVPVSLLLGWSVVKAAQPLQSLLILLVITTSLFNSWFLFSHDFMVNTGKVEHVSPPARYGPPLSFQLELVDFVDKQTGDFPIYLQAVGPGEEHESFLDNYRFLFKERGVGLSTDGLRVRFLFGEAATDPNLHDVTIYHLDAATVALPLYVY